MSGVRRTYQGGSIVIFVITGVILAVLLIGAVYSLKQHSQQARRDQAIAIFDQQQAEKDAAIKKAAEESAKSSSVTVNLPNVALSNDSDADADDLPRTGPELVINQIIGAGLLTVFATSYIMSRRSANRSL
jgi:hypothetical protein